MRNATLKFVVIIILGTALSLIGHNQALGQSNRDGGKRLIELTLQGNSRSSSDHQTWIQALSQVGADQLKIQTVGRPKPSINEAEVGSSVIIQIKAVISGSKIKFPGKTFARTDVGGISAFLDKLRADGAQTTLATKKAFGLTSTQLVDVHQRLSLKNARATQSEPWKKVVSGLLDGVSMTYELSPAAKDALATDATIDVDLNGFTTGTVLAILLRQQGLVFHPTHKQGRGVVLKIDVKDDVKEFWPPGWPVEKAPVNAFPKMFKRIPLQVNQTPLASVLTAIERRLDLPFVVDPAAVKDKQGNPIDLNKTLVSYNKAKTSYSLALSKMLLQNKPRLRHEIRQDENETQFLWISK